MPAIKQSRYSIRFMLLAIVGGLTLIAVSLAGRDFVGGASHLAEMRNLNSDTRLIWRFFDATEAASAERTLAIMAYNTESPKSVPQLLPSLMADRQRARSTMKIALTEMKAMRSAALATIIPRVERRAAELEKLRSELDITLEQPYPLRDRTLTARWLQASENLTSDSDEMWSVVIIPRISVHSTITRHLRTSHYLRLTYEYSGQIRSLAAPLMAGDALSAEQITELHRAEGARDTSWDAAILIAQQTGLYHRLNVPLSEATRNCRIARALVDLAITDNGQPGSQPDPALWFDKFESCQSALDTVQRSSRQAMMDIVAQAMTTVRNTTILNGTILAAALAICIASLWIIFRHVVTPFRIIIQTLERAAAGGDVSFTWNGAITTEVEKLVRVLLSLQEAMASSARRAEEIDRSERTLRAVVDNAMDGIVTIDDQGVVKTSNPASERMFGYAESDVVGHDISLLLPNAEGVIRAAQFEQDDPSGCKRAAITARQMTALHKSGTTFPIELSVSTFETADGRFHTAIIRDITARKQVEADLAAYTQALERSNKELDDFAYIASHDLKEPLRGIHNHARFLLEDHEKSLPEDSVKRLNRLVYLSQRMERLVSDLLYFSRLGRHQLAIQPTDMNALVADVVGTLECFIADNSANIAVETLPTVRCDSIRIAEVFRNLITNAVKYNNNDEKRIEIGSVRDKPTPHGAFARQAFFVRDNGCGIAPEFHEEVFRIFRRLHANTSEKDGTGVGLTFVKKIIERHGGEVWVESAPGQGATFYFTLEPVDGEHESTDRAA